MIGGSKGTLIGSISRRSEVPRSKQEVDMAKIPRNEILLHRLNWLAIQGTINISCAIEGNYTMYLSQ